MKRWAEKKLQLEKREKILQDYKDLIHLQCYKVFLLKTTCNKASNDAPL